MPKLVKVEPVDRELKKHVAAIHIDNRFSLLERKMANVLLLNAYPNLLKAEKHRIRVKDLADMLGFDSNDREYLKKALLNLMRTVISWNIVDNKGHETAWSARPMLVAADIQRSWFIYAYPKELCEKFFNPDIYSRINLSIQKQFTSGYAFALYENCLRYRKTGSTGWFPLDILRKLLGVGDNDYYADFRRFNSKVIKPAVKQVNKASDILLEVETRTEKRRVVAVRFLIKENQQLSLFSTATHLVPSPDDSGGRIDCNNQLYERLIEFGLYKREVRTILEEHDEGYIAENLDIVAELHSKGGIKTTLRAAALDALKNDYRPGRTPYEARNDRTQRVVADANAREREERERNRRLEGLRNEFDKRRVDDALSRLDEDERNHLEADFIEGILRGENQTYTSLRPMFRKNGLKHSVVQGCFRSFARDRLLDKASAEEFEEFLAINLGEKQQCGG